MHIHQPNSPAEHVLYFQSENGSRLIQFISPNVWLVSPSLRGFGGATPQVVHSFQSILCYLIISARFMLIFAVLINMQHRCMVIYLRGWFRWLTRRYLSEYH